MLKLKFAVASAALLWAGQVCAQAAPAASAEPLMLEEIIVTAQKRPERLVDTPVSITAVTAEAIAVAGSDNLMNLNKLVPGLYITQPVYFLSPTVRGVGSTLPAFNESNVAIYVDGVYQPAQTSNAFDLASISSIEVLKGPQGTLFGRNATGGAILVNTLNPSFTGAGKVNLSYARFAEVKAGGYVNVPVSDTVATNLAASYKRSRGYIRDMRTDDLVNGSDAFAARGKLLFQPTDDLELILTVAHTESDDPTASNYQSLDGINALGVMPGAGPIASGRFDNSHNDRDVIRTDAQEYTAHINLDTGSGTLSSITAIKRDSLDTVNDGDATYLPVLRIDFGLNQRTFTQEVNFTSPAGENLSYVVGAYYFHNYKYYPYFQYNSRDFLTIGNKSDALAGYADGTYEMGDFALIGGIRYSTEKREMKNSLLPHPLTPPAGQGSRIIDTRESAWTPRAGLRYATGERSNLYATYSRGFKSGAFNGTSLRDPGVTPETIDAYEVGYKAAGSGFMINAAGFYYNYADIQAATLVITNGVALNSVVNAAKARIYGLEIDASYAVSEALNIQANFGYTKGEYTSFPNAPGYVPVGGGAFTSVPIDATGNAIVRQPKYQASAQVNYTVPVGNDSLTFTLSPSYQSRVYFEFSNKLSQGPLFLLDGSIDYALENGLKLSLFGRNITDREYYLTKGYSTFNIAATYAKPAVYGVSLSYAFE